MKKNLEAQHKELEEKRRVFEEERANWEAQQRLEQQKLEASRYNDHTHSVFFDKPKYLGSYTTHCGTDFKYCWRVNGGQ